MKLFGKIIILFVGITTGALYIGVREGAIELHRSAGTIDQRETVFDIRPFLGGEIATRDDIVLDDGEVISSLETIGVYANRSTSDKVNPAVIPERTIHQIDEEYHMFDDFEFTPVDEEGRIIVSMSDGEEGESRSLQNTNPHLSKTVLGFAPYWNFKTTYPQYQMDRLSVIAYFGLNVNSDGSIVMGSDSGWLGWNSDEFVEMVNKAHQNDVKVVLTVKNFSKSSIETFLNASNPTNSGGAWHRLVHDGTYGIVPQLIAKNADGVNIDYEYIGTATTALRNKFTAFVKYVADELNTHPSLGDMHVSVDVMGTSGISQLLYDIKALGNISNLDYIMVMSYDYHSGNSLYAGPTSPLYGNQYWYTVERAMNDISALTHNSKVLMGIPYYGLDFSVKNTQSRPWTSKNAERNPARWSGVETYAKTMNSQSEACRNQYGIQWDNGDKMTWYRYTWLWGSGGGCVSCNPATNPNCDWRQGYFDNPNSLAAKYDFVNARNLGGIGIWALGYDVGRTELWDVIKDKFSREEFMVVFKDGVTKAQQTAIHNSVGTTVIGELRGNAVIVQPISRTSHEAMKDYRSRSQVATAGYITSREIFESQ